MLNAWTRFVDWFVNHFCQMLIVAHVLILMNLLVSMAVLFYLLGLLQS